MHGDVHKYPIVLLQIKYKGKMHSVKAIVSTCLSQIKASKIEFELA